jgi:hypothetical protein
MFANGIGCRQLATRIALYAAAKAFRSAVVVPGTPSASDAPGAPAVEPLIALGQVGVAGGGVVVTGGATVAGVVVNEWSAIWAAVLPTVALALVVVVVVVVGAAAALDVAADVEALAVDDAARAAGVALPPSIAASSLAVLRADGVLATMLAPVLDVGTRVADGSAPAIRITAATTAVARTTAFFNVCTPIQRLHCPPN